MTRRAAAFAAAGVLLALLAALADVAQGQGDVDVLDALFGRGETLGEALFFDVRLPRALAGIIAGGALAAAAVVLQALTRNPLAEPATLGMTAGGALTVTLAAAYASLAPGAPTIAVAFVGVTIGTLLIGAMAAAGGGGLRLILAGMAVGLALSAASGAVRLARETETSGLFLWGAGSLLQTGWGPVRAAALIGIPTALAILALARALDVAVLGEETARGLGLRSAPHAGRRRRAGRDPDRGRGRPVRPDRVHRRARLRPRPLREAARPCGDARGRDPLGRRDPARRRRRRPRDHRPGHRDARGRGLRADRRARARDRGAQAPGRGRARRRPGRERRTLAPEGHARRGGDLARSRSSAACAWGRSGSARARCSSRSSAPARRSVRSRSSRARRGSPSPCSAAPAWPPPGPSCRPRSRNPFAGPELAGVVGGASVGAFTVLLAFPDAPTIALPFAAFAGALGAMAIVLALAGGGSPARFALTGLAITAACAALTELMLLHSQPAAATAITWLSGSTYATSWSDFRLLAVPALILLPVALLAVRRLDILMLDDELGVALGLRVNAARAGLLAAGAALGAAAVAVCGAIAFVGLLAPHAARLLAGGNHRRALPMAIALGALLLGLADTVGRTVLAPTEIPSGLVVSLIGAPYLAILLWRSRTA